MVTSAILDDGHFSIHRSGLSDQHTWVPNMPKTKKSARKATKLALKTAKKAPSKRGFILARPVTEPAKVVVAAGRKAGLAFSEKYVYETRAAARKRGTHKSPAKGARARGARAEAPQSLTSLGAISPLDLTYAVGRLIAEGWTTAADIVRIVADRAERIATLRAELASLESGAVSQAGTSLPVRLAKRGAKVAVKVTDKKVGRKAPRKAGTVIIRRDGRAFTTTQKVVEARAVQGKYLGYIRQVPKSEKPKFKAIAASKGVPAAVEALKARLGKK